MTATTELAALRQALSLMLVAFRERAEKSNEKLAIQVADRVLRGTEEPQIVPSQVDFDRRQEETVIGLVSKILNVPPDAPEYLIAGSLRGMLVEIEMRINALEGFFHYTGEGTLSGRLDKAIWNVRLLQERAGEHPIVPPKDETAAAVEHDRAERRRLCD